MGGREVEVRLNGRSYEGLRGLAVGVVRVASGRLGWGWCGGRCVVGVAGGGRLADGEEL